MDVPIPFLTPPADIVNQAVDMLGLPAKILGDLTDGTTVAETARRNYGQGLRQLLRTAHWDWARKRVKLQLLGDATGAPPPLGVSAFVERPWGYAYAWPTDAVQGRWLPWNPTNAQPTNANGIPLTTGTTSNVTYGMQPGRYLVSSSDQYPIQIGNVPWDQMPDLQRTEGLGPISRKIILTDCCNAEFVYTKLGVVIEEWDDLFRQAFVTMMALVIAPVAIEDAKLRVAVVDRLRPALKNAIDNARLASANESGYPISTDFEASFIRARNWGGWGAGYGGFGFGLGGFGAGGGFYGGWDSLNWGGSVF